ncbi:MAG TPA: glycosyltransferase [Candidatus Elarobacter sp.]|jgi:cellulose synthase/poly-beta-1,6-N-acetylglucosamine synthase-like glycosyltransferase|nr:glycosyltransferase [Candidatus Elarobacter sp.]
MTAATGDSIVVGIMAYNEAANIGRTVRSIQEQTVAGRINRIIVVASGCTDDTCAIVARMAAADPRIVLVEERLRAGKTVAINTFLAAAHESVVVIPSADLILERTTLEHLIAPLDDPRVGMVGAHPVPTNERDTFIGFAVNLMWELHHRIASVEPKMGELVAFRNQLAALDPAMLSDELAVENQIRSAGLRIAYAPGARVFNRGPDTLREFVTQRVRWCVANIQTARNFETPVSTLSARNVLRAVRELVAETRPRPDWLVAAAAIETFCRLRAYASLTLRPRGDRYRVWQPLRSTKTVTPGK